MQRIWPLQLCRPAGTFPALVLAASSLWAEPAQHALTSVAQVRHLTKEEAERSIPVKVRGTVTYSDPEWGLLFVQDGEEAIFVGWRESLTPGDRVEIAATTAAGHLSPILYRPSIRVIGHAALPPPVQAPVADLHAGRLDSSLVETTGVVREAASPWNRTTFWIQEGVRSVQVILPMADGGRLDKWVDSVVRVRGVCGSRIENGKRTGAQLFVARVEDIHVEMPAEVLGIGEEAPGPRLAELSRQRYVRRVRFEGEVTFRKPGLMWVESRAGSIPVMPNVETQVAEGDLIEVIGFPTPTTLGIGLGHAAVRRRDGPPGTPPVRSLMEPAQVAARKLHGRLVRVRGRLIEQSGNRQGASVLALEASGGMRFAAELTPSNKSRVDMDFPRGESLELLGVAVFNEQRRGPGAFTLMVREVKVLPQPVFLSWQFALTIFGLFVAALAAFGVWLGLLRRTLRRQTAVIRTRLERESQLESEYRRLFERNPAAMFRWQCDGTIVDANPAFARMLGLESGKDLIGSSYWELETDGKASCELRDLAAGSCLANREVALRRADGRVLWLEQSICRVESAGGHLFEATATDVTERRRYREELEQAHSQLERRVQERTAELERQITVRNQVERELIAAKQHAEEMSMAKSTFLANMSHELRTPLNAIIGYSEMLLEDADEEQRKDWALDLDRIHSSARHLLTLINDVLDLAKVEAGRTEFRSERFNVAAMVHDVMATVEPMARKSNNRLQVDFSHGPAGQVADPTKFRQSLLNLLSNACKFTESGEVNLTVSTVTDEGRRWVEWAVSDNGIGIAPEHQHRIFESFSQVDGTATRKYSGTGLGLAISKRYCQHMGGDITFTSAPGRGSRFVIRMPDEEQSQPPAGGPGCLRSVNINSPADASDSAR